MRYFDHQANGFAGVDFQAADLTPADLDAALKPLRESDTRIFLTLITDRIESICAKLKRVESLRRDSPYGEVIAGYHIEGPFLSSEPGYCGAHPPDLMKPPTVGDLDQLWSAGNGRLKLITLAPELPGAIDFIREASTRGITTSIGHSSAGDAVIDKAIEAGMTMCTHLGNGVPNQLHRHDNIIQRLLARDELMAAFIPDGIHVPPAVLRNFVRAKPPEKVIFTTDCMAAAGAPPGRYRIGRLEVEVGPDRVVRQPGKLNFAGSSLTMQEAVENVRNFVGWSERDARAACCERMVAFFRL